MPVGRTAFFPDAAKTNRHAVIYTHAHNFWAHTAVSIASLLEHECDLDIHIFVDEIDRYWWNKIKPLCADANSTVNVHLFDNAQTQGLKNCGYFGLTTYNRLFIPELFAGKVERLIYLDSDMVIRSSIKELTMVPLDGHVLAAVPGASKRVNDAKANSLGHGRNVPYFNAGLMVIDPERWVQEGIRDKCIAFGTDHPERVQLADQDMLNYVLGGNYKKLPMKWNVVTEFFSDVPVEDMDNLNMDELSLLRDDPAIIHYNGQYKPWHLTYRHPHKKDYIRVRNKLQRRPYISDDFPYVILTKPLAFLRRHLSL